MIRRVVAIVLMLATSGSAAESVQGLVRDGAMRSENNVARSHLVARVTGDRGSEDGTARGQPHRHGAHGNATPEDHCMHQHGPAMPASVGLSFRVHRVSDQPEADLVAYLIPSSFEHFNPPRA